MRPNLDTSTVTGFGEEWTRFDQSNLDSRELQEEFQRYFAVFPWDKLPAEAAGFDLGCGSGRWAKLVAPRVGRLYCIDASSEALATSRRNLSGFENVEFYNASVEDIPLDDGSLDFGYSLGVLHHVPDTASGIASCVRKLKPGAPFLLYLYYAFDNRPAWFRFLWRVSDVIRRGVSALPFVLRRVVTDVIATLVYLPFAKAALLAERAGFRVDNWPLSTYRRQSFYTMRTDALDRFGTRLEQRFTRLEIKAMMIEAGLENITFSNGMPYWCAVGTKVSV